MKHLAPTAVTPSFVVILGLLGGCVGTETDNPVSGGTVFVSPDRSGPAASPAPGCPGEFGPGDGKPVRLATQVVPESILGVVHQTLSAPGDRILVAVTQPPALSQASFPDAEDLDPQLRLLLLDTAEGRTFEPLTQLDLTGDFWQMLWKGERLWIATARRIPSHRGCDAQPNVCFGVSYEALVLTGYNLVDDQLVAVETREFPMAIRAIFDENGVVGVDRKAVYFARFTEDGNLEEPRSVPLEGEGYRVFPVQLTPEALRYVTTGENNTAQLLTVNTDNSLSVDAQPLEEKLAESSVTSVIFGGYLWLDAQGAGPARLQQFTPDGLVSIPLDENIASIMPLTGIQWAQPGQAAVAVYRDPTGGDLRLQLLSIEGSDVTLIEEWTDRSLPTQPGSRASGPPSLATQGSQLVFRAAGLPLQLVEGVEDNSPPPPRVTAFIALPGDSFSSTTEAILSETYVTEGTQPDPILQLLRDGEQWNIPMPPSAGSLLPTDYGAVVISQRSLSQCQQSERDCEGYLPGLTLVNTRGTPSVVDSLPFPALPLPSVQEPSRISVDWGSSEEQDVLRLEDGRWVFVASASLTCQTEADCNAMGIEAVPIAEANVAFGTQSPVCPPNEEMCEITPPPPPPTVYGRSRRQYFYVLNTDSGENAEWQFIGQSLLESNSGSPARNSRFAQFGVSGQILFATRLERLDGNGQELPRDVSRVMLDRFVVNATDSTTLPPVNVPGRPLLLLRASKTASEQQWLTLEPQPGEEGLNTLYRVSIQEGEARVASDLPLEPSLGQENRFFGIGRLDLEALVSGVDDSTEQLAVILASANSCAASRLQLVRVSTSSEVLEVTSELTLPSDDWSLLQLDRDTALLQRDRSFALIGIDASGALTLLSIQSTDAYVQDPQLVEGTLRAAGRRDGAIRLEF